MGRRCPACGNENNRPEWEFCGLCGADLTVAPEPVAKGESVAEKAIDIQASSVKVKPPVSAPQVTAKLVLIQGGRTEREFSITGESVLIGRWDPDVGAFPEVDLSEYDPACYVSRHHARIYLREGRYFIEDLGSTNRTVINKAQKLNPHSPYELKNGDEIIVGKTFLKFVLEY